MPRAKGSVQTRRRRKKILKQAKGYFGSKRTLYRTANEQMMRSLRYSYSGRKQRKREFRKLWIQRINAACHQNGFKYSRFVYGLSLAGVTINRKMLADMAVNDQAGFKQLVELSKDAIENKVNGKPTEEVKVVPKVEKQKPVVKKPTKEEIKAVPKVEEEKPVKEKLDLASLTVVKLRELAKEKEITGYSSMRKAELIEALKN